MLTNKENYVRNLKRYFSFTREILDLHKIDHGIYEKKKHLEKGSSFLDNLFGGHTAYRPDNKTKLLVVEVNPNANMSSDQDYTSPCLEDFATILKGKTIPLFFLTIPFNFYVKNVLPSLHSLLEIGLKKNDLHQAYDEGRVLNKEERFKETIVRSFDALNDIFNREVESVTKPIRKQYMLVPKRKDSTLSDDEYLEEQLYNREYKTYTFRKLSDLEIMELLNSFCFHTFFVNDRFVNLYDLMYDIESEDENLIGKSEIFIKEVLGLNGYYSGKNFEQNVKRKGDYFSSGDWCWEVSNCFDLRFINTDKANILYGGFKSQAPFIYRSIFKPIDKNKEIARIKEKINKIEKEIAYRDKLYNLQNIETSKEPLLRQKATLNNRLDHVSSEDLWQISHYIGLFAPHATEMSKVQKYYQKAKDRMRLETNKLPNNIESLKCISVNRSFFHDNKLNLLFSETPLFCPFIFDTNNESVVRNEEYEELASKGMETIYQ